MIQVESMPQQQQQRSSLSACAQCKKRHVACDFERPCSRCKDRNIECTEAEHKKRGPKFRKTGHVYPEPTFQLEENPNLNTLIQSISSPLQFDFLSTFSPSSSLSSPLTSSSSSLQSNFNNQSIFPSSDNNLNLLYQQFNNQPQNDFNSINSLQQSNEYSSPFQWDSNSSSDLSPSMTSSPSSFGNSFTSSDWSVTRGQDQKPDVVTSIPGVVGPLDMDHSVGCCEDKMKELGIKRNGKCAFVDRVKQLQSFLTEEQLLQLRIDFDRHLKILVEASNELEFPILIWASGGVIAHVNAAFREATGWSAPVPTKPEDHALFQIISKKSLISMFKIFPKLMSEELRRFSFELVFKKYGTEGEEYLAGTAAVSLKRNIFGLPQLFHCQFIPSETLFEDEEDEEEEDLSPLSSSSPLSNSNTSQS
eukprot:TRINITY_DN1179_c0_g1_i1.p1 TRINITY_DN1179_c0_g1~~TRINITY_DN1179_c0_g1_i1.p1  ORF type:complete len:420 (-),score=157.33 TRINITY_DN1179_c0_g1_i1:328-1587(-)